MIRKIDAHTVREAVEEAYRHCKEESGGRNADYIPYLAGVPAHLFGIAACLPDGSVITAGDTEYAFGIESVSKVPTALLAMEQYGAGQLLHKIGADATGLPFNSIMAILLERDHPSTPLVNAGAIAACSMIRPTGDADAKWAAIRGFIGELAGSEVEVIDELYRSESATNFNNRSIAWLLRNYERIYDDPEHTLILEKKDGSRVCYDVDAIQTNDKFPDMKELSEQVHAMGLKLGIYSSPWIGTYAAHIGSYSNNPDGENQWIKDGNHNENFRYEKPAGNYWQDRKEMYRHGAYSFVEADARQWADWQIDYLKYDWNPNDLYHVKEMHDALRATDRDIVYSISNSAPYADAPLWVEYTDCWRTTGDIRDTWKSISSIGFEQQRWAPFCGPGHWPDADMLVVGLVGWGPKLHYTKLTADEQYTHMSLWAMLASPLLIGCDLAQLDPFTKSLLTNDEVIAVNQDPLGVHAAAIWEKEGRVIYVKHLEDGAMAVGLFNKTLEPAKIGFTLKQLGIRGTQVVRDLWRQKDLTTTDKGFETQVPPHGVVLVKIAPGNPTRNDLKK